MIINFLIRYHKCTLYLEVEQRVTVLEMKNLIGWIINKSAENMRLFTGEYLLPDELPPYMLDVELSSAATLGLALRSEESVFCSALHSLVHYDSILFGSLEDVYLVSRGGE